LGETAVILLRSLNIVKSNMRGKNWLAQPIRWLIRSAFSTPVAVPVGTAADAKKEPVRNSVRRIHEECPCPAIQKRRRLTRRREDSRTLIRIHEFTVHVRGKMRLMESCYTQYSIDALYVAPHERAVPASVVNGDGFRSTPVDA
jgi:hypothetical protein